MSADFWQRVTSGAIRLTPADDAIIWRMRSHGASWDAIASVVAPPSVSERLSAGIWRARQRRERIRASVAQVMERGEA